MIDEPAPPAHAEIAHVLFMDLVGHTLLPMEEQTRRVGELLAVVRKVPEILRLENGRGLIRLPRGDGAALVFFGDPAAPARCALEIARALRSRPEIRLRMGLHSGPVHRVQDINANADVSGGGINLAQRVMDCGDAGHILLSLTAADFLQQIGNWSPLLHDLGECDVKHGLRLRLFNLCSDELGNPELPEKLRRQAPAPAAPEPRPTGPTSRTAADAPASGPALRVALLYRRRQQPDEELLKLLETELLAAGCQVFVDRHLSVGVEWAHEIERQVRAADAVIPLLSAASVMSEMLACEVEIAHKAASERHGKPRLLPVRVNYAGPLTTEPLAAILDPLHYTLWEGPDDNARLVADLLQALRNPPPAAIPRTKLEAVGGAVPLNSKFYVDRATDEEFHAAIARQDSLVLLKGARQMGKTSLLARGLQTAREAGARVVLTDFQMLNAAHLESPGALFLALAESIADELELEPGPADGWDSARGPNVNFERYWRRQILGSIASPVVWGLDEVDRVFSCSFASEVFGLFRSWHNRRSLDPSGPWSRLTMAIVYATEAHLFITDLNQSPFNVGTRLSMEDFTREHVADLNARYGGPLRGDQELARFYALVGGHPYLVRRGLDEMAARTAGLVAFEAQAAQDEGIFGDHLRRILVLLSRNAELMEAMRGVLRGSAPPTAESFYHLRTAGILAGESQREARPRCRLYADYLQRHLP